MTKLQVALLWCYFLIYIIGNRTIYCESNENFPLAKNNNYIKLIDGEKLNIFRYNAIDKQFLIQSQNYISYTPPTQSTIKTSSHLTSNLPPSDNTTIRTTPTPGTRSTSTTTSIPTTEPPTEPPTEVPTEPSTTVSPTNTPTTADPTDSPTAVPTETPTEPSPTTSPTTVSPTNTPTTVDPSIPQYPTHYHGPWMVSAIIFIVLTVAGFVIMLTLSATMPAPILPPAQKFFIPRPVSFSRIV